MKKTLYKIYYYKTLLNFLLIFLKPTNCISLIVSRKLDDLIVTYQTYLYKKHKRKLRASKKKKKISLQHVA